MIYLASFGKQREGFDMTEADDGEVAVIKCRDLRDVESFAYSQHGCVGRT